MSPIECVVSLDKADGRAHGGADAAAFDHQIMFEPTDQPDAGRFVNNDEPQATPDWRARWFDVKRRRVIVYMRQTGGLHLGRLSNFDDTPNIVSNAVASVTYDFDCQVNCKVSRRRNYTVHLRWGP